MLPRDPAALTPSSSIVIRSTNRSTGPLEDRGRLCWGYCSVPATSCYCLSSVETHTDRGGCLFTASGLHRFLVKKSYRLQQGIMLRKPCCTPLNQLNFVRRLEAASLWMSILNQEGHYKIPDALSRINVWRDTAL